MLKKTKCKVLVGIALGFIKHLACEFFESVMPLAATSRCQCSTSPFSLTGTSNPSKSGKSQSESESDPTSPPVHPIHCALHPSDLAKKSDIRSLSR